MTTQDSNRMIALFNGWTEHKSVNGNRIYTKDGIAKVPNDLNYAGDWNILMPIIEKISLIPLIGAEDHQDTCYPRTFNMPTEDGKRMFRFNGFACHNGDTLIQAAYSAVVEAIQIINSQKEK